MNTSRLIEKLNELVSEKGDGVVKTCVGGVWVDMDDENYEITGDEKLFYIDYSENKFLKLLPKILPEYWKEFSDVVYEQLLNDYERWGDTWKQRGLIWSGQNQETRFKNWLEEKYDQWDENNVPFPWKKIAGEACIGYIREEYLGK